MKSKKEIREEVFAKQEELSSEYYEQATQAIHEKLLNFDLYKKAETIYIFYSMGKELDTKKIIEHAHQEGNELVFLERLNWVRWIFINMNLAIH